MRVVYMSHKSDIEAKINQELALFNKKWTGRGPKRIKSKILEDMLIIRFQLYKHPIYEKFVLSFEGSKLSKTINMEMFDLINVEFKEILEELVCTEVKGIFFDGKILSDEMVIVVVFCRNIEIEEPQRTTKDK